MRKKEQIWQRFERSDRVDGQEEDTNVFSPIHDTSNFTHENLADGQPTIFEDKMLIKKDGVLKKLVIDSNNNIILEEI